MDSVEQAERDDLRARLEEATRLLRLEKCPRCLDYMHGPDSPVLAVLDVAIPRTKP